MKHLVFFSQLDNDGPEMHGLYSFAVITDDRELLLAASSEEEKYKWMEVRFKMVEHQESKVTDFFSSACPGFSLPFGTEGGQFLRGLVKGTSVGHSPILRWRVRLCRSVSKCIIG